MLLCFPMFTNVLSTDIPTQLPQEISRDCRALSMTSKMLAAIAEPVPDVRHISRNLVETRPWSGSKILTVTGFIFLRPLSFDPSIANEKGLPLMCDTRDSSKWGCRAMLTMHDVFVLAAANPITIFESGKMSLKRGYKWIMVARGILWCARAIAILTSALLICRWFNDTAPIWMFVYANKKNSF